MENKVKIWLARDKDMTLCAFSSLPFRDYDMWSCHESLLVLDKLSFPEIQWEDEPIEAYITLSEPKKINWEQRMAEIAESIFITEQPYINCEEDVEKYAEIAIQRAKILINKLKKESDNVTE